MSIVDELKAAIRAYCDRGGTVYRLAQLSGVPQPSLHRFLSGERDLRLESAALVCEALGLHLAKRRKRS